MSSKFKKKNCIYCDKPATTKDHVPQECFFPKPAPKNLITVPSCFDCNNSFADDENYVRTVLASARLNDIPNSPVEKIWNQKVQRSLQKNPKVLKEVFKSFLPIDVYHGSIYFGKRPGFRCDRERVDRIMGKIVKGLFYFENKKPLPNDFIVKVFLSPNEDDKIPNEIKESICTSIIKCVSKDVFKYRTIHLPEDPNYSVWVLNFYDSYLNFICLTWKELKSNNIDKI